MCHEAEKGNKAPIFTLWPVQLGLAPSPWRVAVASILLNRTRCLQVRPVLQRVLQSYPCPQAMCIADDLEELTRPCGLHRQRSRQLVRFSNMYLEGEWQDFRELPGVGVYVHDAVALFCFGQLDIASQDIALQGHIRWMKQSG